MSCENLPLRFLTWTMTDRANEPQKMARDIILDSCEQNTIQDYSFVDFLPLFCLCKFFFSLNVFSIVDIYC